MFMDLLDRVDLWLLSQSNRFVLTRIWLLLRNIEHCNTKRSKNRTAGHDKQWHVFAEIKYIKPNKMRSLKQRQISDFSNCDWFSQACG